MAGSTVQTGDVRELTRPLWQLAENAAAQDGYGRPPLVRFVWGKAWNIPGVVAAVAERLEHFTQGGAPRRSWLRMRLLRVAEPDEPTGTATEATALAPPSELLAAAESGGGPVAHEVLGAGPEGAEPGSPAPGQRLDELAFRYYGIPSLWRLIAAFNNLADPLRVDGGSVLRIPPRGGTS